MIKALEGESVSDANMSISMQQDLNVTGAGYKLS